MEEFKAIAELFGLDIKALGAIAGFLVIWIAFLKSQFPKMKGLYTTIVNVTSASLIVFGFMYKTQTLSIIGFLLSTIICWIGSAGIKAVMKTLTNGGDSKHSPAFKIKDKK